MTHPSVDCNVSSLQFTASKSRQTLLFSNRQRTLLQFVVRVTPSDFRIASIQTWNERKETQVYQSEEEVQLPHGESLQVQISFHPAQISFRPSGSPPTGSRGIIARGTVELLPLNSSEPFKVIPLEGKISIQS